MPVPDYVVAFSREVKGNKVIVIANFGKEDYNPVFNLPGEFVNHFTGEAITAPYNVSLAPGEYIVITSR